MANSNVIQFPKCAKPARRSKRHNAAPHPDDVFLEYLHSLLPEDQDVWRASIRLAASLEKEGRSHKITLCYC